MKTIATGDRVLAPEILDEVLAVLQRGGAVLLRGDLSVHTYVGITGSVSGKFLPYLGGSNHGRVMIDEDAKI